mmetsp:Transcript_22781/g.49331  ORF Transcript_22781/g.49331 Transcript_22781/m.49331 type:complete len:84 (+) Transcript_22781:278-529(+)
MEAREIFMFGAPRDSERYFLLHSPPPQMLYHGRDCGANKELRKETVMTNEFESIEFPAIGADVAHRYPSCQNLSYSPFSNLSR